MPNYSGVWNLRAQAEAAGTGLWVTTAVPNIDRGVFIHGYNGTVDINVIQYITISTTGNSIDFGDTLSAANGGGGLGSTTRGVFARSSSTNVIEYITFNTTGNSIDFGDLTKSPDGAMGCLNSSTRGVFGSCLSPFVPGSVTNIIDYITIATTGNAIDFGDAIVANGRNAGTSSSTRGVFAGGFFPSGNVTINNIDYITIATTGNAIDFGDLTVARDGLGGGGSSTRGIFCAGALASSSTFYNVIDYITIATTGNAIDFGDYSLSLGRISCGSVSNSTRSVFGGGTNAGFTVYFNVIEFVTTATTGNSTDFGDLLGVVYAIAACSSANGGVQ